MQILGYSPLVPLKLFIVLMVGVILFQAFQLLRSGWALKRIGNPNDAEYKFLVSRKWGTAHCLFWLFLILVGSIKLLTIMSTDPYGAVSSLFLGIHIADAVTLVLISVLAIFVFNGKRYPLTHRALVYAGIFPTLLYMVATGSWMLYRIPI